MCGPMSGAPRLGALGTVPVLLEDDSPAQEGIVSNAGASHVTGSDSAPRRDIAPVPASLRCGGTRTRVRVFPWKFQPPFFLLFL